MQEQARFQSEPETRDFLLKRALERLRAAMWEGRYAILEHAQCHARAEGFAERDVIWVLQTGRVRAIYPEEDRWLVGGEFAVAGLRLPLHVVVDFDIQDGWIDVVTAFIPKQPYQIVSRGRLALMLRHDQSDLRAKLVGPGRRRRRWHSLRGRA
jgi:hypothetical protein